MAIIKADDVAYVRFSAPDLDEMRSFGAEFGLSSVAGSTDKRLLSGGIDGQVCHITELGDPSFLGMAMRASSLGDLELLANTVGTPVTELDLPGGGYSVRMIDPDGFVVDVIAGQVQAAPQPIPARQPWNSAQDRPRRNEVKRLTAGPATVLRLGHVVLAVSDVQRTVDWWSEHLGVLVSDEVRTPDGHYAAAFLRCDRGDIPTDHHSLNFATLPSGITGFHHAAFEVMDFDDLVLGGEYLAERERDRIWGVGRHILGSQVFDYWADPWGHKVEHWTDGDFLTADDQTRIQGMDVMTGVQWGPGLPSTFL